MAGGGRERWRRSYTHLSTAVCNEEWKKEFPNRPWKIKRIKDIRSYQDDYLPFIHDCRSLAKEDGCLLIELELYWLGAQ